MGTLLSIRNDDFFPPSEFSEYHHNRKPLTTWIPKDDYETFCAIAARNGVSVSAYLRAMVVDVLAEEGPKVKAFTSIAPDDGTGA